jgi:SET domain-containing protein
MTASQSTGLCYPYTIRVVPDKGRGVFTAAAITKGAIVWRYVRGRYEVHDEESFRQLLAKVSHRDAVYELEHVHSVLEFPGYIIRVLDDGALINHSSQPTVMTNDDMGDYRAPYVTSMRDVAEALVDDRFALIATRDIDVGEELANDYNLDVDDPPFYDALCEEYGVTWEWL